VYIIEEKEKNIWMAAMVKDACHHTNNLKRCNWLWFSKCACCAYFSDFFCNLHQIVL